MATTTTTFTGGHIKTSFSTARLTVQPLSSPTMNMAAASAAAVQHSYSQPVLTPAWPSLEEIPTLDEPAALVGNRPPPTSPLHSEGFTDGTADGLSGMSWGGGIATAAAAAAGMRRVATATQALSASRVSSLTGMATAAAAVPSSRSAADVKALGRGGGGSHGRLSIFRNLSDVDLQRLGPAGTAAAPLGGSPAGLSPVGGGGGGAPNGVAVPPRVPSSFGLTAPPPPNASHAALATMATHGAGVPAFGSPAIVFEEPGPGLESELDADFAVGQDLLS